MDQAQQKYLIDKYDQAVPRYTSYPTVPQWQEHGLSRVQWTNSVLHTYEQDKEISLYIHLPFCESMCTFCGCNKRITKNHKVEEPYIELLLKEWEMYLKVLGEKPILKELHLGGGTPTFFTPKNLESLLKRILQTVVIPEDHKFGFEAHPSSTTTGHLETLSALGFKRLSIGVQDFDQDILRVINRHQKEEDIYRITEHARTLGYDSINFDLVFGLPFQTVAHMEQNMLRMEELLPDRIAYYSYAHVPWKSPSQRAYSEKDLPIKSQKRQLYEYGKTYLESLGYKEIGLDHFALPTDKLYSYQAQSKLNRNFMGYTTSQSKLNLAIGVSSISESIGAYVQNEKHLKDYTDKVNMGLFPLYKGHELSLKEQVAKRHITELMCHGTTSWPVDKLPINNAAKLDLLEEMSADGILELAEGKLSITNPGKPFLRNICTLFDDHFQGPVTSQQVYSSSI